jgi:ferredoxin
MLYIDPDECIDCSACEPACPVNAIYFEDDVPTEMKKYVQINADFFKNRIFSIRLDGSGYKELVAPPNVLVPRDLELHSGSLYWTDDHLTNSIRKADLTGRDVSTVIDLGELRGPTGIAILSGTQAVPTFIRGDANGDGKVQVADPVWIVSELFRNGPPTSCQAAADATGDGVYDVSDALFVIRYYFQNGPAPGEPFPACGPESVAIPLSCDAHTPCL